MSNTPLKTKQIRANVGQGQHLATRIADTSGQSRIRHEPRQTRSQFTVEAILEAAGQLLVTCGRAAVTTNAVAKRAGVSIGSLYQYFPSKEAIFDALVDRHRSKVMPLIEHALGNWADPSVDLVEGILLLMRAMVALHNESPSRMRALAEELHEESSAVDTGRFVEITSNILSQRFNAPAPRLRAAAWLACTTVTHVGRVLVHQPPPLDTEEVLMNLGSMLRGLFANLH